MIKLIKFKNKKNKFRTYYNIVIYIPVTCWVENEFFQSFDKMTSSEILPYLVFHWPTAIGPHLHWQEQSYIYKIFIENQFVQG